MLVYTATKNEFLDDVRTSQIDTRILEVFKQKLGRSTSESEIRSWRNSMQYMFHVMEHDAISSEAGIAIEYGIAPTAKRIDFMLSGYCMEQNPTAVIIELKQWDDIGITEKDGIVEVDFVGKYREFAHPSYQAWSYAQLLRDFNEYVYTNNPALVPCAYLHNCTDATAVRDQRYETHLNAAPVFVREDVAELSSFIAERICTGDEGELLRELDESVIRPSKDLADHMAGLLKGNPEFVMIDDQKLVYETALSMADAARTHQKQVLIVKGGPGTGKSVVAINLLVELLNRKKNAQYLSTNQAPRAVYERRLAKTERKSRISALFKGTAGYVQGKPGDYDCLIVDESHRLVEKTRFNKGENQIKEIIHSANCSVFFIDESQRVTMKDIGTIDAIQAFADIENADVEVLELASQFRCNGSDGYLAWLDHNLGIRETANPDLSDANYDFRVCDSPAELLNLIRQYNQPANKSRVVAGYCWPWLSEKDHSKMDIVYPKHGFAMQWNFTDSGTPWLIDPKSLDQIGCIHTCQGLELEYVGVILGKDFLIRHGKPICDFGARARNDSSWKGFKTLLKKDRAKALLMQDEIVKNTYRVLMSRGQKGCFIWSVDDETNAWFRSRI